MSRRGLVVLVSAISLLGLGALVLRHGESPGRDATRSSSLPPSAPVRSATDIERGQPLKNAATTRAPLANHIPTVAAAAKPATESRAALSESSMPVVAALSIDRQGSPREQLLTALHGPSESRVAQLDRLDDRARAHLARLREQRAAARGDERARLDQAISLVERNQAFRERVITPTVHSDARPGATRMSSR